jgi:hypothetical protein
MRLRDVDPSATTSSFDIDVARHPLAEASCGAIRTFRSRT